MKMKIEKKGYSCLLNKKGETKSKELKEKNIKN